LALFALGAAALAAPACNVFEWNFYFLGPASTSTSTSGTTGTGGTGGAPLCMPGATQPCYGGPPGTEGVGLCQAGTQTCAADGASWGPCAGEVLPQVENCATPEDEDCDGLAPACQGKLLWAERFGDAGYQDAKGLAVDGAGNVLIVGEVNGSLDFGGGPIPPPAFFVVKLDPAGALVWSRGFSGTGACKVVAVDSGGSVLVTGSFHGSIDFGGGPLTAGSNANSSMFVVKLDQSGQHVWSKSFGDGAEGTGIALDSAGDLLLTGSFHASLDLGGGPLLSAGNHDYFVAKLGGDSGQHKWSERFGEPGVNAEVHVAVDGMDGVLLAGSFAGALDFGAQTLASVGSADLFVAKLDPAGVPLWSTRWGTAGMFIGATGLAASGDGGTLVTGFLAGSVDVGGGTLTSSSTWDVFAAKLDGSGGHLWSKSFGGPWSVTTMNGPTVAADETGNALFTGAIEGVADFGGGQVAGAGGEDAFVAKLGADGGYVWAKRFGDAQDQRGTGIAADGAGNVVLLGGFAGSANLGAGPLTSAGDRDILVAKFSQ
jgi:hypothetical protein